MRHLTVVLVALIGLSGCAGSSGLPEWIGDQNPNRHGYTSYDPCIRCGQGWIILPNAPQGSNDRAKLGRHGN
jgi:hypothetical protein